MTRILLIGFVFCASSCITYTDETDQKFQENRDYMFAYLDNLGFKDSPFFTRLPSNESDKQKKKMIAFMSKEEIKAYVDRQTSGVPRIDNDHTRASAFMNEVEGMKPEQAYEVLTSKYPGIIVKD